MDEIRFSRVNPKITIYKIDDDRPGIIVCLYTEKNLPTSLEVKVHKPIQFIR